MLCKNFKDYEEFKELYVREDGQRKNSILLSFTTSKELFDWYRKRCRLDVFYGIKSMNALYDELLSRITQNCDGDSNIEIVGWNFKNQKYYMDSQRGLCFDGDVNGFRYVRRDNGQTLKKKVGRLIAELIDGSDYGRLIPRKCKLWICEELANRWRSYVAEQVCDLELVVDDDFESIYDREECYLDGEGMGSCMENDGFHTFYNDAVQAKAASLRKGGFIVSRCVIFTHAVQKDTNKVFRLAERQYAIGGNELYKRLLIAKLIERGLIDAYKPAGASCHEPTSWLDTEGVDLPNPKFSIECNLEHGDTLSYQDTFKWYVEDEHRAYNYRRGGEEVNLEETDGEFRSQSHWDSWNDEWSDYETIECWHNGICYRTSQHTIEDTFVYIEDRDEYHHTDNVAVCPNCNKPFLLDDGYFSETSNETFCCVDCRAEYDKAND